MEQARPAIDVARVSKIYRRYSQRKQFATLKCALLSRSLIKNLRPDETFTALNDVNLTVPRGRTLGVIGRNGRERAMTLDNVLVVAPHNMQVNLLRSSLPDGTRISGPCAS